MRLCLLMKVTIDAFSAKSIEMGVKIPQDWRHGNAIRSFSDQLEIPKAIKSSSLSFSLL